MHKYEYMDADGDTLRIMTGYTKGQTVVQIDQKRRLMGVNVLNEDAPTVAAELLKAAGHDNLADLVGWESAEKKLQERRDALAEELGCAGFTYGRLTGLAQRAIDRIIELEDGK